jgi:hypothetical protein
VGLKEGIPTHPIRITRTKQTAPQGRSPPASPLISCCLRVLGDINAFRSLLSVLPPSRFPPHSTLSPNLAFPKAHGPTQCGLDSAPLSPAPTFAFCITHRLPKPDFVDLGPSTVPKALLHRALPHDTPSYIPFPRHAIKLGKISATVSIRGKSFYRAL